MKSIESMFRDQARVVAETYVEEELGREDCSITGILFGRTPAGWPEYLAHVTATDGDTFALRLEESEYGFEVTDELAASDFLANGGVLDGLHNREEWASR